MSTTPNFAPTTLTLGTASTAAPPLPFPTSSASNIASAQSSTSSMADSTQKPKLANGVIAGIVGGGVLGVCLLVGSILLFVYCRRRRQEKIQGEEKKPLPSSFRPKPRPRSNSDKSLTSLGARDSASHFPQPPSFRHTKWPGQSPSTPLTGVSFPPDTPRTPASHNGSTRTISELLPPRPVFTNTPPMPMPLYKTHANGTSTPKSRNNGDISPWDAQDHKAMAAARATMWPTPSTPPQVPPKEPKYDPRGLSVRSDIGPYNSSHSKGLESSVSGHGSSTSLAKSRSSTAPHSTTYTILPHIATAVATAQPVNFSQPTSIHRANTGASSVYSRPDHSNSQPPSPKRAEPLPSVPAPLRIRTPGRPTVTTRTGLPLNHHHQRMLPMHAKTYSGVSASSTNSHPYAPHPSPALHAPASFTKLSLSPLQSQYSTYSPYTPEQSPEEHSYLRSRARDSVQSMHTHIDDDDGVFEEVGLTTVVESPSPVGAVQYPEIPPSGSPVRSAPQTPKSANSGDHPGARAQWGQPAKPYAPRRLEREESYSGGRF
ncbi:MAG: hypothetical protein M1814_002661 [Vezdaea aestivalis]|nr:MAG: hypothetical protein M1814_002661 [Vezdaea aestivalis]